MKYNPKNLWDEMRQAAQEELGESVSIEMVLLCFVVYLAIMALAWLCISAATYLITLALGLQVNFFLWVAFNFPLLLFLDDAVDDWMREQ